MTTIRQNEIEIGEYTIREASSDSIVFKHEESGDIVTIDPSALTASNAIVETIESNVDANSNDLTGGSIDITQGTATSGSAVTLEDANNLEAIIDTTSRNINRLAREVGLTRFEAGLTRGGYPAGLYDVYADTSNIASDSGVSISTGIDGSVALANAQIINIGTEQNSFTVNDDRAYSVFVDSGSAYIGTGYTNYLVEKIDTSTFSKQAEFTGHTSNVQSVYIDGSYGYSGSVDDSVKKWDTDTMTQQNEFTGHTSNVRSVYIDGSYGYSGSGDNTVKKWDTDTMTQQNEFTGHTSSVRSVYIDGSYGYSGSGDYTVKKWDTDTMTEQAEFTGHTGTVYSVYIDGSYGYSGSYDDSVKKWDTDTMTQQNEFTGHTNSVYSVYIDGSYGYSGSNDNTVKKWGEKQSGSNQGTVEHQFKDVGFVPERVVLGYDAAQNDGSLYFEVEDDAGNIEQFSNPDTEITLSSISTQNVKSTLYLERPSETDTSPEVDSWAMYLDT